MACSLLAGYGMRRRRLPFALCMVLFSASWLGSPLLVLAEEPEISKLPELSLEELAALKVVSASTSEQRRWEAPATIYVFTADQILRLGYRNLAQLLQFIPEVEVNARGTIEPYYLFTFRGVGGGGRVVLIYQDGIRISAITGSPTATHFNFPLQQAKRVEVIIGPASALYGADALIGIINIYTWDPEDLMGGSVTASAGRFSTFQQSGIYGRKFGDLGFMLYANHFFTEEPRLPDYYPEAFAGYFQYASDGTVTGVEGPTTVRIQEYQTPIRAFNIGGKFRYRKFELGYQRSFGRHSSSNGARPQVSLYIEEARISALLEAIYARQNFVSESGKWGIRVQLSKGSQAMQPDSKYVNRFTEFVEANGYKYETDKRVDLNGEAFYQFTEKSRVTWGLTYSDLSSLPKSADLPASFDTSKSATAQGFNYLGTDIPIQFFPIWYQNLGTYAELQSQVLSGVNMTLGLRYDHDSRFGGTTNPRVGFVFSPSESARAKILYGEAFLAPSPYIAYSHFGSFTLTGGVPTGGFFQIPNPDLEPEKLRAIEAGVEYRLSKSISVAGDLFVNQVRDVITTESISGGLTFQGVPVSGSRSVNRGILRTHGGTARMDFLFRALGASLKPTLAYTYVNGDLDTQRIPNAAAHTVKTWIDARWGRLSISPQFLFRSRSYVLNTNAFAPSYGVLNLAARFSGIIDTAESDGITVDAFLNIWNLLDRRYANSGLNDGFNFGAAPQDPLRAELGVTVAF